MCQLKSAQGTLKFNGKSLTVRPGFAISLEHENNYEHSIYFHFFITECELGLGAESASTKYYVGEAITTNGDGVTR
jgi:hypothetical protein